jgi:hypothetical protein
MINYSPAGFGPNSVIGPHQGVRVTFAQSRSLATPDFVERADFRDNIAHLVDTLAARGGPLAPASEVTITPDALAATIDFAVTGSGSVSVAQALQSLQDALYGPLDIARRTYIRDVALLGAGGIPWGTPISVPKEDSEGGWLAGLGTIGLLVGLGVLALVYAPEIKTALRRKS